IFEIAGRGHFDSLPVFLNLVFLWSIYARKPWAPALLGLGALAKISSLALPPSLLFHLPLRRAGSWVACLPAVLALIVWSAAGASPLRMPASRFRWNGALTSGVDFGLLFVDGSRRRRASVVASAAGGRAGRRGPRGAPPPRQALWFMGMPLLCCPTLQPWC